MYDDLINNYLLSLPWAGLFFCLIYHICGVISLKFLLDNFISRRNPFLAPTFLLEVFELMFRMNYKQ